MVVDLAQAMGPLKGTEGEPLEEQLDEAAVNEEPAMPEEPEVVEEPEVTEEPAPEDGE